jgi:hypothetical protein
MSDPKRVFIVLEHPDMTYYGDAEIKGVYATRAEAEARARAIDPSWTQERENFTNYGVEEWTVGEPES